MQNPPARHYSFFDRFILETDRVVRTLSHDARAVSRPSPAAVAPDGKLSDTERQHSAGLMRVNHAGEVCAQALYQGQALTAKLPKVRDEMEQAAIEEIDHLQWCEDRLQALDARPSVLNPLWYGLSFGIGAGAGLISDRISLGFVAATEEQVCQHLQSHLQSLPEQDEKSREIVKQMLIDEEKHGHTAIEAGGAVFPKPVKSLMTLVSKAMTGLSYRI